MLSYDTFLYLYLGLITWLRNVPLECAVFIWSYTSCVTPAYSYTSPETKVIRSVCCVALKLIRATTEEGITICYKNFATTIVQLFIFKNTDGIGTGRYKRLYTNSCHYNNNRNKTCRSKIIPRQINTVGEIA